MKPKSARRFLNRNAHKIGKERVFSELSLFGYFNRKKYKKYFKALRKDQANQASRRVYQRFLWLLR